MAAKNQPLMLRSVLRLPSMEDVKEHSQAERGKRINQR